jgi:hypothetical protein
MTVELIEILFFYANYADSLLYFVHLSMGAIDDFIWLPTHSALAPRSASC